MDELNALLIKDKISENEEIRMKKLKEEMDNMYIEMTKGAFIRSRAKWLEKGEKKL